MRSISMIRDEKGSKLEAVGLRMTGARDVGRDGLQASRCLFIVFPAREASCFLALERHLDPTGAHPTCHSCRVCHDKSMVRNVLGNHRTRSDQSIAPDCNAT